MGITLVTGGTGFVGSHVVRALLARGDDVRVTVRSTSRLEHLAGLAVERTTCDLLDRRQVRRALTDVDRVFHCAGMTSLRAGHAAHFRVNVLSARTLMSEALVAGVQRVVHTSSFAAVGPARGQDRTADEAQPFAGGHLRLPYVDAMRETETEVLRIAARGLDVVIACPTYVFGRGDTYRSSTELVRRFLRREIPAYVNGTINVVDVADVAAGLLLADERGETAERYLLGNRNYTLDHLFADLGRLSGVEPPAVQLPLAAAVPLARLAAPIPGGPAVTEREIIGMGQRWAYRSTKAKRMLGWAPGSADDCLQATIDWYREREPLHVRAPGSRQPIALRMAGLALRNTGRITSQIL